MLLVEPVVDVPVVVLLAESCCNKFCKLEVRFEPCPATPEVDPLPSLSPSESLPVDEAAFVPEDCPREENKFCRKACIAACGFCAVVVDDVAEDDVAEEVEFPDKL